MAGQRVFFMCVRACVVRVYGYVCARACMVVCVRARVCYSEIPTLKIYAVKNRDNTV